MESIVFHIVSKALFASVVALGFGLISNPPRRAIWAILLTAFLGYLLRAFMMDALGLSVFSACFCAALLMGCSGLVTGKLTHTPATVIYIPSLLPMIPGMYAYKAIFAYLTFMQNIDFAEKAVYFDQFFTYFSYSVGILICLALGSIIPMFVFTKTANSLTRSKHSVNQ